MKKSLYIYCLFFAKLLFSQNENYMSSYSFHNIEDTKNESSIYNFSKKNIFSNLTYTCFSNNSYNLICGNLNLDSTTLKNSIFNISINNSTSSDTFLIDYKNNTFCELINNMAECKHISNYKYKKTKHRQTINGFNCIKWIPENDLKRKIEIWASKDIPKFVNPAWYIPELDGGVCFIFIEDYGIFCLDKINKTGEIKVDNIMCQQTLKNFNFLEQILNNKFIETLENN